MSRHFTVSIIRFYGNVWDIPAADGTIDATTVAELASGADCQAQHCPGVTTHGVFSLHIHRVHSTQPQTSKQESTLQQHFLGNTHF